MRPVREAQLRDANSTAGDVPPQDLDAEAAVISACLGNSDITDELAGVLRAEDLDAAVDAQM